MNSQKSAVENAIKQHHHLLQATLRRYVVSFGLASGPYADQISADIYQDMVLEALTHADRYDCDREALPWLLGIGVNIIRRRKRSHATSRTKEVLARDVVADDEQYSESDIFEHIRTPVDEAIRHIEVNADVESLLSVLSEDEQMIIRLAIIDGLNSPAIAEILGISANTARVRLHRALKRFRVLVQEMNS